jgi:hypothetical protein
VSDVWDSVKLFGGLTAEGETVTLKTSLTWWKKDLS